MPTSRTPATRAPAKRAAAKRAPAKSTAKRAPAKSTAKRAPAKSTAKRAPSKSAAKRAPAKSAAKRTATAPKPKAAPKTTGKHTAPKTKGKHTAPKPARSARRTHEGPPPRWRRVLSGDRPMLVAMFAVLAVFVAMLLGPLQSFTSASERVDELEARKAQLTTAVDDLEQRRSHLLDPEQVELLAREELGMVRPGEVPYVVTGREGDVEKLPRLQPTGPVAPKAWWQRVAGAFGRMLDRSRTE